MVISEAIYGWYPPAQSRWTKPTKPGQPVGYEAECLYKHWKSRYNGSNRGVATPESPSVVCIDMGPPEHVPMQKSRQEIHGKRIPSPTKSHSSKASSRASSVKVPKFHTPPLAINSSVSTHNLVDTIEDRARPNHHQPGTRTPPPRPMKAWAMHTETTAVVTPSPVPHPPPTPKIYSPVQPQTAAKPIATSFSPSPPGRTSQAGTQLPQSGRPTVPSPPHSSTQKIQEKKPRVQSAPPQREAVKPKQARPIKSAGPTRPEQPLPSFMREKFCKAPSPAPSVRTPPTPPGGDYRPKTPTTADCKKVLDYDSELKKHGWRMEIPGDPLGLKAPCIAPRLSITKKIPIPSVPPNPPTGHMQVFDTYFYNTIPRKPLSFTIHPEWVSEVLHAKRLALQKKEGLNFKHTNYTFAY